MRAWVGLDMRRNLRHFPPVFSVAFQLEDLVCMFITVGPMKKL